MRFESSVQDELNSLYNSPLSELAKYIDYFSEDGEIVTVCVLMGAAAAAGDREQTFQRIVHFLKRSADVEVVPLKAADHAQIDLVIHQLESIDFSRPAIIAVDDADRFPESVIRDMIYICDKVKTCEEARALAEKSIPPLTLVLGVGISDSRFHSALGIGEAAVILPAIIRMPTAIDCFRRVVNALSQSGLELSRNVFDLLCGEFIHHDRTIAMVMRSLRLLFTLHFYREPLAAVFCRVLNEREGLHAKDQQIMRRMLQTWLNKQLLMEVDKKDVPFTGLLDVPVQEANRFKCLETFGQLQKWKTRLRLLQRLVLTSYRAFNVSPRWDTSENLQHNEIMDDLQINIFRGFLVDDETLDVKVDRLIAPILGIVRKAGRPSLRQMIDIAQKEISKAPIHSFDEDIGEIHHDLSLLHDEVNKKTDVHQGQPKYPPRRASSSRYARGGGAARDRRDQLISAVRSEVHSSDSLVPIRKKLETIIMRMVNLIIPLKDIAMHETILVSNIEELQSFSGGMGGSAEPRTSLFTAMRQPSKLMEAIPPHAHPDVATAYRILAEGGRLVSLYDWYNNFASIATAASRRKDEEGNVQIVPVPPAELQARFARACSELEFLGVMKYTNRKSDHVARLVFE